MENDEDHDADGWEAFPDDSELPPSGLGEELISIDDVMEALSDPTRRFVLQYLRREEVADVDELARAVAARETETTAEAVDDAAVEKASITLSHSHLEKLADLHLVEFDRRSATVRYADPPARLEAVLRLLELLEEGGS